MVGFIEYPNCELSAKADWFSTDDFGDFVTGDKSLSTDDFGNFETGDIPASQLLSSKVV